MMQPLPCASIEGIAYLVQRKTPRRLTFITWSQSSTGSSCTGRRATAPALLTRMSMRP